MRAVIRLGAAGAGLMLAAAAAGCAQPAQMNNMVSHDKQALVAAAPDLPVRERVALRSVTGGEDTDPMWTSEVGNAEFKEALRQSLLAHHLLAPEPARARYLLDADLQSVDQPAMGLDMTVAATVRYRLVEPGADGAEPAMCFDELVAVPYTAELGDAFMGVERLRLANEGAIRSNIAEFLDRLIKRSRGFPDPEAGGPDGDAPDERPGTS